MISAVFRVAATFLRRRGDEGGIDPRGGAWMEGKVRTLAARGDRRRHRAPHDEIGFLPASINKGL